MLYNLQLFITFFRPIHAGVIKDNINLVKRSCFILRILQQPVDLLSNSNQVSIFV